MPDSVRRAGFEGEGLELGEALFDAILAQRVGRRLHRRRLRGDLAADRARRTARSNLVDPRAARRARRAARRARRRATPTSRSCCRRASGARHTANTIYRDPAGGRRTPTARCASTRATPRARHRRRRPRARHDQARQRRDRRRGHRHAAAGLRDAARTGSALAYPDEDGERRLRRRRAERAHRVARTATGSPAPRTTSTCRPASKRPDADAPRREKSLGWPPR